jgi:hypothetical protein
MIGIVGYQKFLSKFETSTVVSKARISFNYAIILQSKYRRTNGIIFSLIRKRANISLKYYVKKDSDILCY